MKLLKFVGIALGVTLSASIANAQSVGKIRIAEADSFSAEDLPQLIAYARAKQRGVEIQATALKSDDIAFQAVLNGQMDMGVGDSYEAINNLKAPIRNIYQIRKLAYVPVVDKTIYPDWKSLNGQTFVVHSRGSGTETMAQIMEKKSGIKFDKISYVPGSEVRVVAMQRGNIKATYLDLSSSKVLIDSDPKRFAALPVQDQDASDSTFYVSTKFAQANPRAVQILLEELLKAARATAADPSWPAAQRKELKLLPDLSDKEVADITPYFTRAVAAGIFPVDGGGKTAAQADVDFLSLAGKLKGETAADLNAYWDFAPLEAASKAVGSK